MDQLPMDQLRSVRPEIIGGLFALAPDGNFTETVAFRSVAVRHTSVSSSGDGRLPAMGASMRSLGLQLAGGPECRQQLRR